ncbi:PREDICTED: prominin-1-A-like isoform X4 [Acropora digitifera]|uniref:prominin-1-A-like isoform X4 n=1 Tax=Acropora digitifera TaxID=70779 RepID=UPI00077AEE29|nr:PREDICTED: prominin-1-A-like isoform X4 [Acropora digitifera]
MFIMRHCSSSLLKQDYYSYHNSFIIPNVANKIDLSRVSFRNILEGEGLVLANELQNDVGDCHPIRNVYDVIVSDFCDNAVGLVNTMWLCLGDIALLSVLTIILCVRLAKHLRRAKTGEEFYSEDLGSSNYGFPTRLFLKFLKLNRKRFTMPWRSNSSSPTTPLSSDSSPEHTESRKWRKF